MRFRLSNGQPTQDRSALTQLTRQCSDRAGFDSSQLKRKDMPKVYDHFVGERDQRVVFVSRGTASLRSVEEADR
jgi:hypothetical protein